MTTAPRITISVDQDIADVRMVRGDALNALDVAMFEALADAPLQLQGRDDVRVVILSGEGKGFCAGMDLGSLGDGSAFANLPARTHGIANLFQAAVWNWRALDVPVIAAVHGYALGGGCQLMLGADVRIAHPDTQIALLEAKYGLVPDMGAMALLRHILREDVARDLTYSARILNGREAQALGLVTQTADDPRAAAYEMAQSWAKNPRAALVAAKSLFNLAADSPSSAADMLLAEAQAQHPLIHGPALQQVLQKMKDKK